MKKKMYRQGDVLLIRTTEILDGKKVRAEKGRLILARGEATGHHHSVPSKSCELLVQDQKMMLVVREPTTLDHQEHATIEIARGSYWVVRQREYTPAEIRRVRD